MIVKLRPEASRDETFLRHLVLETIEGELCASSWPEPLRAQLLATQYDGRRQIRRAESEGYRSMIIEADSRDAGWLVTASQERATYLVEIMILPQLRGRGIGSAAIGQILADAQQAEKSVRLNVNVINPAVRLYRRLGFQRVGGDEVQHLMESSTPRGAEA